MKKTKNFINLIKKYKPLIFIIGLFVFICALMANRSIWFDESYSAQTIKGTFGEIAETTAADVHPPLYYWLLKIWASVFGRSLVALRSFSIFCGVIAIIFAFLTFKKWSKSTKMATFLTLAIAICPYFIYYSTEIRMYSLVTAIVMASVYFLELAIEKNTRKYWLFYALTIILALYTHYFSGFAFLAEYIYLIVFYRKKIPNLFKKLATISALVFIVYLPWIPSLFSQVMNVERGFWIDPVELITVLRFFSSSFVYNEGITDNPAQLNIVIATLVALIIVAILAIKSMGNKTREKFCLVAFLVFIPFLSLIILSIPPLSPVYIPRYLTYSLTILWVLVAILIAQTHKKYSIFSAVLLILMLICSFSGIKNIYDENEYTSHFDVLYKKVEQIDGGKTVPIIFNNSSAAAFDALYYATETHPVYIIGEKSEWYASKPLYRYGNNYIDDLNKFREEHDTFWLLTYGGASARTVSDMGDGKFEVVVSEHDGGFVIYKFEKEKDLKTSENLL